jgi:hypothetical protein
MVAAWTLLDMNEKNPNSLVERYYTWEKLVLVTALLLVFWKVFGLVDTTAVPLLNAVLHEPGKFPHATCIMLLIESFFMWIEWRQSDKTARQTLLSRVRCSFTFAVAFIAIWINTDALTKGTFLEGVSRFWYLFYFCIGLTVAFFSSVLVLATLMIQTEEKGKGGPITLIPVATRCVYRAYWPVTVALLLLDYVVSCHAPLAILNIAPWITAVPIAVVLIGEIAGYFFVYDEHGNRVLFRQNISKLKDAFKMHDYLYFLNRHRRQIAAHVSMPPKATPQEQQDRLRQILSKDSGNILLVSRAIEGLEMGQYPIDGNRDNKNPDNWELRTKLANPQIGGLRVETWPNSENPPKSIRQLILKTSYLEKHAKEFLKSNSINDSNVQKFYSYVIDRSVEDTLSEEALSRNPLHWAASNGRQDVVEQYLEKGKDINEQDQQGWTPLLHAVANGYPKMVKLMLAHGANPDIANLLKITPLMYAARYGNLGIAKILLDFGASINMQDAYGETALAVAVRMGQEALVRLFISKGAEIDTRSTLEKLSPLEMAHALGFGKIARLLRKARKGS